MERNTIQEMKAILDAIEQGKKVQFRRVDGSDEWVDYGLDTPDFFTHRYRIKPEKKWRPFKDFNELLGAKMYKNGIWVKVKDTSCNYLVDGYTNNSLRIDHCWWTLDKVFTDYTFADGTPCGVEEDA